MLVKTGQLSRSGSCAELSCTWSEHAFYQLKIQRVPQVSCFCDASFGKF